MIRLGNVQMQALRRMEEDPVTAADLASLGSRSTVSRSLGSLAKLGAARQSGIPNAAGQAGRPRVQWALTRAGRELLAELRGAGS